MMIVVYTLFNSRNDQIGKYVHEHDWTTGEVEMFVMDLKDRVEEIGGRLEAELDPQGLSALEKRIAVLKETRR